MGAVSIPALQDSPWGALANLLLTVGIVRDG
jgi:hypothetical protein